MDGCGTEWVGGAMGQGIVGGVGLIKILVRGSENKVGIMSGILQ